MTEQSEAVCCPRLDPEQWDEKDLNWDSKKFVKARVATFMYMPLNFGSVITKLMNKVEAAGAQAVDNLCLSDHVSKWGMDIYLAVDKDIPGLDTVNLSGHYLSKVYEGNFKDTGKWCEDFNMYIKRAGFNDVKKLFMWYTTCPKCAKKYGKNYVVILGEV